MTALALQAPGNGYQKPVLVSVAGHLLLLLAFSTTVVFIPRQSPPRLAIEATLVSPDDLPDARAAAEAREQRAAAERERQEALAAERRRAEAEAAERRAAEAEAAAAASRAREQREQAEQQRQAEAAERERQAAAERQRKAQAEREAAAQREREAAAAAERERKAAAEKARREAEAREQAQRQAELMAALEAEEALASARSSDEFTQYIALIRQSVERKWVQPASAVAGVECEVSVQQLPSGDVISAKVTRCNGDETVRRSVENAVRAASPLPLPANRVLFDRNLVFTFRPQVD